MIDTVNNRKLPENFADRVLTLEMELDRYGENIGVEKIKELLEIYCQAIEYYESIDSSKYMDLTERMQFILVKPIVLKALDKKVEHEKLTSRQMKLQLEIDQSLQDLSDPSIISSRSTGSGLERGVPALTLREIEGNSPRKIIGSYKSFEDNVKTVLENDIRSQNKTLDERLEARRSSRLRSTIGSVVKPQNQNKKDNPFDLVKLTARSIEEVSERSFSGERDNPNECWSEKRSKSLISSMRKISLLNPSHKKGSLSLHRIDFVLNFSNDYIDYRNDHSAKKSISSLDDSVCGSEVGEKVMEIFSICEAKYLERQQFIEDKIEEFIEQSFNEKYEKIDELSKLFDEEISQCLENADKRPMLEILRSDKERRVKEMSVMYDDRRRKGIEELKTLFKNDDNITSEDATSKISEIANEVINKYLQC